MKMNKKGFTLIEMLVVIAIIAILVAIVIPVVGSSTAKAQAATNAANLRSAQAALQIAVLNDGAPASDVNGAASDYGTYVTGAEAPEAKGGAGDFTFTIDTNGNVEVFFGGNGIEHFAGLAGSNS